MTGRRLTAEKREQLKDELKSHRLSWPALGDALHDLDAADAEIAKLIAEVERLRAVLEDISMNVSMSMPLEWTDEVSWYRSQLGICIGRAARGVKEIVKEKL